MLASALLAARLLPLEAPAMSDLVFEPAAIFSSSQETTHPDSPKGEDKLRVLTYNIRHCAGTDDRLDLERTAKAIGDLKPDFVALQEVDLSVRRSEGVNQPQELGRRLGMHSAFGSFMDYDGGQYGLALLSRFRIKSARALRLPNGHEPRVALFADVVLPSGRTVTLVNLHFDWVSDDGYRFAQASLLATALGSLASPWILMGDFNDQPGSRTIKLFQNMAVEAKKPSSNRFTFSSIKPESEIDFIFAAPAKEWTVGEGRVIDLPVVSDHRPVLSELVLRR